MKPPPSPHPEGLRPPGTGPTDPRAETRKRMPLWDRIKFVLALTIVYLVLVWNQLASFTGIMTFQDAMLRTAIEAPWIFWLLGAELLRQLHFLVSERSAGYHRFWTRGVFGGFERWSHRRFSDWNRFRTARAVKWLFWIAVLALVLGEMLDTSPALALFEAPALLWQALPYAAQLAFAFFFIAFQFIGLFWLLSRGGVETYFPDDITTRFSDVWGQDHVVERVKENIVFLERPDEIEERGGYVPSGLLLWGPPGTGKTLMAEAVAGETGKPYVFVDPGAFVNMFMGIGILKVKSLFRKLRKLSLRYGGVIVFFDEADSLGRRGSLAQQGPRGGPGFSPHSGGCHGLGYLSEDTRWLLGRAGARAGTAEPETGRSRFFMGGNMGGGGDPGTLQALLTELSGLKKPRGIVNRHVRRLLGMRPKPPPKYRILVMMATNMPDSLDEALLRPGRIDRIYKVGYPSKAGRVRTYRGYFDKVRHELTDEQLDKLATITPYATGATIKDLVNESLITAIRDGREVITWSDVTRAKRLKQLGPPEDVEYIERERHAVAVHEACHAVAAYRTRYHLEIDIATIEKGADYLGMVASIKPEDQFTRWKSEHEADIVVSLASLAGERMFFAEDNSSGVSGDLYSATYLTALMEAHWGMGRGVTSVPALQELEIMGGTSLPKPAGTGGGARPAGGGQGIAPDVLGERIEYNLVRLLERTEDLLRAHRREVLCLAHALETDKTLNGDDVVAVIEHRRGPLVDGSVYASDDFYAEIEEYHREAARAHREHSRVARDLPVPAAVPRIEPAALVPGAVAAGNGHGSPAVAGPAPAGPEFVPWAQDRPETPPAPPARATGPVRPGAAGPGRDGTPRRGAGEAAEEHGRQETRGGAGGAKGRKERRGLRRVAVIAASLVALAAFTLLGADAFSGGRVSAAAGLADAAGRGASMAAFAAVVAACVLAGIAFLTVRAVQAARVRAEAERDRAVERAQLLAAALDPEIAMRVLGYDGGDRRAD
ncbi:AAA family ATPase [Planomonospora sp. ID82291]|nr:AAA family ATPase [Planomonospora sp. ID82291]